MTFTEYKQILDEKNIILTSKQEVIFQNYFNKINAEKVISNNKNNILNFSDFSYMVKNGITDLHTNGMVSKLQRMLESAGFEVGAIDGYFGPQTIRALEQLKTKHGIMNSPYGIFDPRDFDDNNEITALEMFLATDEVFFYSIPESELSKKSSIKCNDIKVSYIEHDDMIIFPVTFPYYKESSFTCDIETKQELETFLTIHKKENQKETSHATLTVSKKYSTPNAANDLRIAQEKEILQALYKKHAYDEAYFDAAFDLPIDSELISPYGKTRIMNGVVSSFHTGTDWRSRTPEPIRATNNGMVMFTGNLFYCGNTVIINHGLNIFTIYCHLSSITAETGDLIEKGEVIGNTGATGRVSGAHLHVSSKFENKYMDFMSIYNNSKILK